MSSWLSLGRRPPEGGADESKDTAGSSTAAPPMDPEEVRRRRIERLEAAAAAQAEATRQQQEKDAAEAAEAAAKAPPTPTTTASSSSPAAVAPPTPMDISTPSSSQQDARPSSSSSTITKVKASELATHRLIQRVLYVTADANDTNGGSYVYVPCPTEEEGGSPSSLYTLAFVSELICVRLSLNPGGGGGGGGGDLAANTQTGVLYLAACYARQEEEGRSRRPGVTEEGLKELREQVVNFGGTSIMEPDVFGLSSLEVKGQLVKGLVAMAESPAACMLPMGFLKGVLDGMEEGEIPRVFAPVLSDLLGGLIRVRKLSDPGAVVHTHALVLLVKQHKALVEALVMGVANFILPAGGVPMPVYNPRNPLMQGGVRMQRNGRAHESFTTLGVLFRLGFPETDPEVLAQFENLKRRTKVDLDGKMNTLRNQVKVRVCVFIFASSLPPSLPPSLPACLSVVCVLVWDFQRRTRRCWRSLRI